MFEYPARLLRVVDGDTVWLDVDLGFRASIKLDFRLAGINAPEVKGDSRTVGLAASTFLMDLLGAPGVTLLTVKSSGVDKYGRWLATIYLPDGSSVNDTMVASGHAVPYMV